MWSPAGIVVGEARAGEREVGVSGQPADAAASSWSTRCRRGGSAGRPRSCRRRRRRAARSRARGTTATTVDCSPRTRTVRRPTSAPLARTSGVTRSAGSPVVGSTGSSAPRASLLWKPMPGVRVELGAGPWAEHGGELRAHESRRPVARVQRVVGRHRELIDVGAQAERRAERARPFDLALRVRRRSSSGRLRPRASSRAAAAPRCDRGRRIEPVAPDLHADGALGVRPKKRPSRR